jgi:hypothetical protein
MWLIFESQHQAMNRIDWAQKTTYRTADWIMEYTLETCLKHKQPCAHDNNRIRHQWRLWGACDDSKPCCVLNVLSLVHFTLQWEIAWTLDISTGKQVTVMMTIFTGYIKRVRIMFTIHRVPTLQWDDPRRSFINCNIGLQSSCLPCIRHHKLWKHAISAWKIILLIIFLHINTIWVGNQNIRTIVNCTLI